MIIDNIKKRLKENSKQDNTWLEKAKWRQENESWLKTSFAIAVKILAAFRANKKTGAFPKNQKELAFAMGCTPQYINKLLKGSENLQLETISKIENILNIKLIQVPELEDIILVDTYYQKSNITDEIVKTESFYSSYMVLLDSYTYNDKPALSLVAA